MGYWEQSEEGHSFEGGDRTPEPLIWGDQPADLVDNAINAITAVFVKDVGRLPSKAEVMAGLTFSTRHLALPDRPEDAPTVSDDDIAVVEETYYPAVHGEEPHPRGRLADDASPEQIQEWINTARRVPAWKVDAQRKLGEVLRRLTGPYEPPMPTSGDGDTPPGWDGHASL